MNAASTFGADTVVLPAIRLVLTFFFLASAYMMSRNFSQAVEEMKDVGLPLPRLSAMAAVATQVIGSLWVVTDAGHLGWIGAGGLAVFTLLTIPFGHAFWKFPEPQRSENLRTVLEHVSLVGGLLLVGWMSYSGWR